MATEDNAMIIALTETWLTDDHEDAEVGISGYTLYRADRTSRARGGVCIYIREGTSAVPILEYSNGVVKVLALKVRDLEAVVFVLYRPPDSSAEELSDALTKLDEAIGLAQANSHKFSNILGFGDYNLPGVRWEDTTPVSGSSAPAKIAGKLLGFMEDQFLVQLVKDATRLNNILDLVLSNNQDQVSHIAIRPNVKMTDHATVCTYLTVRAPVPQRQVTKVLHTSCIPQYDLSKADREDWTRYNYLVNRRNWEEEAVYLSLEEKIAHLTTIMEGAVREVFPRRQGKVAGNRIPLRMRKLMTRRRKLSLRLLRTESWEALQRLRGELEEVELAIQESHGDRRAQEETKAIQKINVDPGSFYDYAKKFSRTHSQVGPLQKKDGEHTLEEVEMSELLKEQYSSVFSIPRVPLTEENISEMFPDPHMTVLDSDAPGSDAPDSDAPVSDAPVSDAPDRDAPGNVVSGVLGPNSNSNETIETIIFSETDVCEAVGRLSNTAAPGPDGVPTLCLKMGGKLIITALLSIYQESMDKAMVDESMKTAFITPIWKGGTRPSRPPTDLWP
jgi:hypothetical protein